MQSNVVIIEPSSAGVKLIDASLALNHKVYLLTYDNDDRIVPNTYHHQCEVIQVDTNDELAMRDKLIDLHAKIPVHAIIPGFEYYVPAAARLNAYFNLKGLLPNTVDAMRFKHIMRRHLLSCGVRMPWFVVVNDVDDLKQYKDIIRFPCVIKPSHLAGSLHIIKVNDFDELAFHLSNLLKDDFEDLGKPMAGEVLIEEYLDGKELSVEGYVSNGNITFVSVTDKFLGPDPNFVEIGHIVTANITADVKNALLDYTCSVISALKITLGPFHCEIRLTEKGPVLIEIAARLPGDNISELIELATGISLAKQMVKGYLGASTEDSIQPSLKQYAGVRFIYARNYAASFFSHLEGMEMLSKIPGFHRFGALMQRGTQIHPFTDYRARIAEVIFTGATYDEVKNRLALADNLLQVKVVSHG